MTNEEILEVVASEACIALFKDYSVELRRVDAATQVMDAELLYCGVIGFAGNQMRGAVMLATSREPLGRTSPVTDPLLREWIAELSNQLLGRVKNKLLTRGVVLQMSIPVAMRGHHLTPLMKDKLRPLVFECENGCVCVWIDTEIAEGVDLSVVQNSPATITEGEGMLF